MPPALARRYIAFGECWPRGHQGKSCLIEGLHATVMVGFVGVNNCDKRSSIGESHRLACSRAMASLKAFPDFRARPPPP
jgi:hypothetical protein